MVTVEMERQVSIYLSYLDAILGTTVILTDVDGESLNLNVPAGTQPGDTLRVKSGRSDDQKRATVLGSIAVPSRRRGRRSYAVTVNIQLPKAGSLSDDQLEALSRMRADEKARIRELPRPDPEA